MAKRKRPKTELDSGAAVGRSQRHLLVQPQFWEDLHYWEQEDSRVADRLMRLVEETRRDPFQGIGKPEPLRREFAGVWSRRLTDEHRFVYRVVEGALVCLQGRYHYK
ncbi:MAG TPA: Txe/YoeB family addiction module toxin [Longimicrobium sp.]